MQIENRIVISADDKASGTLKKVKGTFVDLNKEAVKFAKQQSSIEKAVRHDARLMAQVKSQQGMAGSAGNSTDTNKDRDVDRTTSYSSRPIDYALQGAVLVGGLGLRGGWLGGLAGAFLGAGGGIFLGQEVDRFLQRQREEEEKEEAWLNEQTRQAKNDFMPTVTPTEPQLKALQAADQAAQELAESKKAAHDQTINDALQWAKQDVAARDKEAVALAVEPAELMAANTEIARDRIATAMHGVTGIFNETFENGIKAQAKWINEQDRAVRKAVEAGNDFANGWRAGLNEYVRDARNVFRQAELLAQTTAQSMQHSFSDFFFDAMRGQLKGFEDYLNSFVVSVQRAVADMTAQRVTGSLISGFSGLFSAHGNVFDRGQVLRFASGGVVSSPTLFPLGVMGEAGPEAILPLQRTRSGDLGVRAEGRGGDVVNVNFTVKANDSRSFKDSMVQNRAVILGVVQDAYNKRGKRGPLA